MKSKYKIKIFSFFFVLSLINSTIITEGYHFFDIFYYRDIYKHYLKQKKNNKCSIEEGPNCIFIKSKNEYEIGNELKNIDPDINTFLNDSPENIYLKLKNTTKAINEKEKETSKLEDEVFQFDSPYVMSLLLSFESYEEKTRLGDIYAPETIDTPFDLGRVTLTILGKLRLSQKNSKNFELPTVSKEERPMGTYAYVESKEVIIKFNLKSTISSLYIKKNKYNQNNKTFYLYGYKNGIKQLITKVQNVPSTQWTKINGDGKKYESIGLMRGFDYDNILILSSMDGVLNYNQLTKQFSSVINEKIRDTINEEVNKIKSGKGFKNNDNKGGSVKVIKINLDEQDIITNNEEDFELPEELLKEIENNENNKGKNDNSQKNNKKVDDKVNKKNITGDL